MILVHKLKGEPFWVNPDLISFVESNHDTVLTLSDGRHLVVADRPDEIAAAVREHRAATLALAFHYQVEGVPSPPLRLVPDPEPDSEEV